MAKKITYWIATLWASLGLVATALVQILKLKTKNDFITDLGYPGYFLTLIGIWKILAVIALLTPGFVRVKEWAYAGLFFLMSGAIFSHLAVSDPFGKMFPALLLFTLILVSWYSRPANRKLNLAHQ